MTQSNQSAGAANAVHPRTRTASPLARKLAITLGSMSAAGPFAVDMYLPAFPTIAVELGTTTGRVQLTLAAYIIGLAVGQIIWGTLSDHLGRRLPLACGCLLAALMSLVVANTHSIDTMIVARFFMGLGGTAGMAISRAIVRDLFEEKEAARFFSMMMVIAGIGPIVSPFLGTLLLTQFTWRSVFWLTTLFALFCVYCAVWLIPETLPRERRLRGHVGDLFRSYGNVLSNRRFLAPAISVGCVSGILFTYLSNAPFVFIQLNGIPLTRFSLYFAPVAVGVYISSQANRFLLKRFATGQLLRRAMVANVCGGLLLTVCAYTGVGGFPALYACLFLCLSTIGVIFPNGTAMTMQPFASQAGTASAMLGVVQFAVGAAAGALSGLLHNGTAMPMALQILGFGILARGVIALTPRRPVGA